MPRQQQQSPGHSIDYAAFDPNTMDMLQQVVEDAWRELVRRGDPVADAGREPIVRELLAHRVMSRATRGDTDPLRLLDHALWGFFALRHVERNQVEDRGVGL